MVIKKVNIEIPLAKLWTLETFRKLLDYIIEHNGVISSSFSSLGISVSMMKTTRQDLGYCQLLTTLIKLFKS